MLVWKLKTQISDMYAGKNETELSACNCGAKDESRGEAATQEVVSLFGYLVGCVGPEDGARAGVRPLLEQGPRCGGVGTRLGLVTLGEAT